MLRHIDLNGTLKGLYYVSIIIYSLLALLILSLCFGLSGCAAPAQKFTVIKYKLMETEQQAGEWQATAKLEATQDAAGKTELVWEGVDLKIDTKSEGFSPLKGLVQGAPKFVNKNE